jgi:glycosyl transferase family 2
MEIALSVVAVVGLAYWVWMAYAIVRSLAVETVRPASDREQWPGLTVVVPACNEAGEIEPAARSLLSQDYPNLRVIFVDDRSGDTTGQILDGLVADEEGAEVVHLTDLPTGWLGKVHALHTGLQRAESELVLLTDADVRFEPGALRAGVDHMARRGLDHLAGFPRLLPSGLLVGAMVGAFLRQFVAFMRPWRVDDPSSRAFIGVGAFNLIRRKAFVASGGFEWLRMEVGDDAGVGLMMKRAGRCCAAGQMADWIFLHWHRSFRGVVRGAEKGWSSVCRFSLLRTALLGATMVVLELAPLWMLALLSHPGARWIGKLGVVALAGNVAASLIMARRMRQSPIPHLVSILIAPLGFVVMLRTALLGRCRGGALWRGTLYPTEALREGMRLKFP